MTKQELIEKWSEDWERNSLKSDLDSVIQQAISEEKEKVCKWKTLGFENYAVPGCLSNNESMRIILGEYCPFCGHKIEKI